MKSINRIKVVTGKPGLKFLLLFALMVLHSCMDDDQWLERNRPNISAQQVKNGYGVVVVNEGNFMYGNGSLSYYDALTSRVENDIYYRQNGVAMGDVVFSANQHKGLLYVVVNNSGKILILNAGKYPSMKAFDHAGKITGFTSPRHIHFLSDSKAYVSDLYARAIAIVDPSRQLITGSINVNNREKIYYQHPTEQLVEFGAYVFTNCYSYDNKILVIDTLSSMLADSIEVLKQPSGMVLDSNKKLWALCDGGYAGESGESIQPGLVRINPLTRTIEKIFPLDPGGWVSDLCINGTGDTLYFLNRDVWRMPVNSLKLPEEPFVEAGGRLFYALGVDPLRSEVYAGDAIDYVQQGMVYRYSSSGQALDSFPCGISPTSFLFIRED